MSKFVHLGAVAAFVVCVSAGLLAKVKVWQGRLTLPTYEEGPPDPNPRCDQFAGNKFNYPYVLREKSTNRRANHEWRAIHLENEYLKCSVLPTLAGIFIHASRRFQAFLPPNRMLAYLSARLARAEMAQQAN